MARSLAAICLLLAACFALDDETYEPTEPPSHRRGIGLEAEAVPSGPDFDAAEVVLYVNGEECDRRTMSSWKPRWTARELCGEPTNHAELQFVAPAGSCLPGGVYVLQATTADPDGKLRTVQGEALAAWGTSGAQLPEAELLLEKRPTLHAHEADAEPPEDAALEELGHWTYRLEFSLESGQARCPDNLQLSLLKGAAPEYLAYRIVRTMDAGDGTHLLRVRPEGEDLPAPKLHLLQGDGRWKEMEGVPADEGAWLDFHFPVEPERYRFSFSFERLPQRMAARMAYEPRQEIEEALWVETEHLVPRIVAPGRMLASEAPEEPLPLAEHLAHLLGRVAALQEVPAEGALRLRVDARFEQAGVFRSRLALVHGEAEYRGQRDENGACEEGESLPCALAEAILGALEAVAVETKEGAFLLGLRSFTGETELSPQVELREVVLPSEWVTEIIESEG